MSDEVREHLSGEQDAYNEWVGVDIGLLAVLPAICSVGGGNATKDAIETNIAASDTWTFFQAKIPGQDSRPRFQAKNIPRTSTALAASALELMLAAQPGIAEEVKRRFEDKINEYRADAQRLTSDPVKKEGLDQLFTKAKALEADRDVALAKDPDFDWSQAFLQIAIVLASVHLSIGNLWLLGLSGGLGALGIL